MLDAIDALVDEQMAHPANFHQHGDQSGCPHCGGKWHGLPGSGPVHIRMEGHIGAEAYPEEGNGGIVGCPGAFASADEVNAWKAGIRQREQLAARRDIDFSVGPSTGWTAAEIEAMRQAWQSSQPYVDQIANVHITPAPPGSVGTARLTPAGPGQYDLDLQIPEGGPPPDLTPDNRLRVHPGAIIPGGRRPAWAPPEWPDPHQCNLDRNGRCVWAHCPTNQPDAPMACRCTHTGTQDDPVVDPTGCPVHSHLAGWRTRWVQGNPRDALNAITMAPNPLLPPAGEALQDASGAIGPDGTIDDAFLANAGFEPVGHLGNATGIEIALPDPASPLYDDVILAFQGYASRTQPDIIRRAQAAIHTIAQAIATAAGEGPEAEAVAAAMAEVTPPLITLYDADMNRIGGGRAYTLEDVARLRNAMWEHRGEGHVEITTQGRPEPPQFPRY